MYMMFVIVYRQECKICHQIIILSTSLMSNVYTNHLQVNRLHELAKIDMLQGVN